jgi:hypothetical protein
MQALTICRSSRFRALCRNAERSRRLAAMRPWQDTSARNTRIVDWLGRRVIRG